jgi:hypothetical protein
MAGGNGFSVTISAVDNVTKTLDGINKELMRFTQPYLKIGKATSKLYDVSGAKRLVGALGGVRNQAAAAAQSMARIVEPLGIITGAASIAGLTRMVTTWGDLGSQLGRSAQRIGITVTQLNSLQGAARLVGSSADAVTSGLQNLGQTMFDAIGGRAPEAIAMFNTLGIRFEDAAGHARSVAAVMPEVADKIASIKDPYVQARIATTLFGGAAESLLPFLRQGSAGIARYNAMAIRYGAYNEDAAKAADQLRMAHTKLDLSLEGLRNRIAVRLAPTVTKLLTHFADMIADSPAVGRGIDALGMAIQRFGAYIGDENRWQRFGDFLLLWGGRLGWVVDEVGGVQNAIEIVAGFMAASFALKMIAPWWELGKAVGLIGINITKLITKYGELEVAALAASKAELAASVEGALPAAAAPKGPGALSMFATGAGALLREYGGPLALAYMVNKSIASPEGQKVWGEGGELDQITNNAKNSALGRGSSSNAILNLISHSEGTDRGQGYNTTFANGKYTGGSRDLTSMTLDQIDALQTQMIASQVAAGIDPKKASGALGKWQITQHTLRDLRQGYGFSGDQRFDAATQDALIMDRINQSGGLTQENLAHIFASVPDPKTGRSYYGQRLGSTSEEWRSALGGLSYGAPLRLSSPGGAAGQAGANGKVQVQVGIDHNMPPGSRVTATAQSSGGAAATPPIVARTGLGYMEM